MTFVTRFAPSPTGPLHLGHAYSALLAHDRAKAVGGIFLLRIDDLDRTRARPEWEEQIYDDLRWLGLSWPEPCRRQSDCMMEYDAALDRLWALGLLYPCTCTRRDIREALSAPQESAAVEGPDGLVYPGTCRPGPDWTPPQVRPIETTLRLNMTRAVYFGGFAPRAGESDRYASFTEDGRPGDPNVNTVTFTEREMIDRAGDVVLARKDIGASYHLSVVVDDAAQGVTQVIRGEDLLEATKIHWLLQQLLDLPVPNYHHHRLIRDEHGNRLAKRDDARAIATYRAEGATPANIRRMVGL